MASAVPVAGSAYTYAYATLGELVAWIIGWDLILEYAMGAATVGVGWSATFVSFVNLLGIEIPAALTSPPFLFCSASQVAQGVAGCATAGWQTTGAVVNLPAVCIILAITTILVIGIRETAGFNSFIVLVKTGVLIVFVAAGLLYVQRANWRPFIPPNTGTFGEFGWSGVLRGAELIFFAFIGFDAVLGLGSTMLVMLLGQSRVFYSMSRDGLLGAWAGKVHPRFRTPYLSSIYTGIAVAVFTGLFPIQILGQLVNIGTMLAFALVCGGVWVLRHERPELERPFRTPLVPLVPILGIVSCLGLMLTLPL